jgi:hypothetical protein
LIRLPLLTSHPPICAQTGWVLRPFCAQLLSVEVAAGGNVQYGGSMD